MALFCAGMAWELTARSFVFFAPKRGELPNKADIYTGRYVHSDEGYSIGSISPEGYRTPLPPSSAQPRVLVLGDSYSEALQVSDSQTYAWLLQEKLKKAWTNAGVWNAGISGGSPARYIGMASYFASTLKPDITVIQFSPTDFDQDISNRSRSYYVENKDGEWHVRQNPPASDRRPGRLASIAPLRTVRDLILASALYQIIGKRMAGGGEGQQAPAAKPKKQEPGPDIRQYTDWVVAELKKAYGSPIIAYIPNNDYFQPDLPMGKEEGYLQEAAQREGLRFVNLRGYYHDHFRKTGEPCHGFANTSPTGHINAIGHRIFAEQVARLILDQAGVPGSE